MEFINGFRTGNQGVTMYKTIRKTTTGALLAVAPLFLQAEPAVYHDGQITIPEGAVIMGEDNSYFTDITLGLGADGKFQVTGATSNSLVFVDNVDVSVLGPLPVQVSLAVSGNLSVPCVELLNPAVSREGNTFTVVLAESNLGPAESCIAVLEPFETTVDLDVAGLPAGDYTVEVNGVSTEFTLDMDNPG